MIRTRTKILGEVNDPNTVLANESLTNGKLIVGAGNKGIKTKDISANSLLYGDSNGNLQSFNFSNQGSKYIGTNEFGQLTLLDKVSGSTVTPLEISKYAYSINGIVGSTYLSYDSNAQVTQIALASGWLAYPVDNMYWFRFDLKNPIFANSKFSRVQGSISLRLNSVNCIKEVYLVKSNYSQPSLTVIRQGQSLIPSGSTADDFSTFGSAITLPDSINISYDKLYIRIEPRDLDQTIVSYLSAVGDGKIRIHLEGITS